MIAFSLILTLLPVNSLAKEDIFTEDVKNQFNNNGYIDVLIQMKDEFYNTEQVLPTDSEEVVIEKRESIIDNLKKNAEESQKEVLSYLKDGESTKQVQLLESYYSTNTIRAIARIDVIEDLDRFQNIAEISLNDSLETRGNEVKPTSPSWNLYSTDVPSVWNELGTKGEGVTIGFIDSGVYLDHPALKEQFRGYDKKTGKITIEGNWHDFVGDSKSPVDDLGHGTASTGVAVGGGDQDKMLGVAPESKWIAVRAFSTEYSLNTNIIKAGEWMLAPGGDVSKAPDVINNSWGGKSGNEKWFNNLLRAWLDAGIFPVFAAGNEKGLAEKGSIENPASLLEAFSVGSVDGNNYVSKFSKRGPSTFDPSATVIKPEVVAPGNVIYSANKYGKYSYWTGTSMAAPHVSGVVALMKSVNKHISNSEIRKILIDTATPLTDRDFVYTPNMAYGHGLVNARKAVEEARELTKTTIPIERVYGANRVETSTIIASKFFESADVVYIANGKRFSDGLAIGPLTFTEGEGPLLLTDDRLAPSIIAEIKRLNPKKIIVVGGENAVKKKVFDDLKFQTGITVERLAGVNRFETNAIIAKKIFDKQKSDTAFLVNGLRDADALSISSQAAKSGTPILLTRDDDLHENSKNFLMEHGIKKVTIIGGPAAVSTKVIDQLKSLDISTEVVYGSDRYETSSAVNKKYFPNTETVYIANGINGADALSITPKAGKESAAIQLIRKDSTSDSIKDYLKKAEAKRIFILGGELAISGNNQYSIENLFR